MVEDVRGGDRAAGTVDAHHQRLDLRIVGGAGQLFFQMGHRIRLFHQALALTRADQTGQLNHQHLVRPGPAQLFFLERACPR